MKRTPVTRPVTELVKDDLCFIVGDAPKPVERDVVRVVSMTRDGRYRYTDVANRPRAIPTFQETLWTQIEISSSARVLAIFAADLGKSVHPIAVKMFIERSGKRRTVVA